MTSLLRRRSPFDLAVGAICAFVVVLVGYPVAGAIVRLFSGDESFGSAVDAVLHRPDLGTVLLNTLAVISASTLIAVVVGSLFAWLNERTDARMGWATDVLPVVSLLVPSIAGAIGWVLLAAPQAGFVNVALGDLGDAIGVDLPTLSIFSWPGLILVYTLYMIPQVYLTVAAALRNVDPALDEAARVSGRTRLNVLWTVTLPVVRPAIVSGALLALVYGIALFSVPLIIGTQADIPVLTVEIVRLLTVSFPPSFEQAMVMSVFVVVAVGAVWAINARVGRRGLHATVGGKASAQRTIKLGRRGRLAARAAMLSYVVVACVLPVAALLIVSLQGFWSGSFAVDLDFANYQDVFAAGSQTWAGLRNSLVLGVVGATLGMLLALLVAYRVLDRRGGPFGRVLDAVTKLPGTLSHVVIAIAFIGALAGPPLDLADTLLLLLIAYVVLYLPQATVTAESSFKQVGNELFEASRVAGQGPGSTLRRVGLPLMFPGLAAGWAFVFVLIVGDITASVILAGTRSQVIGFVILDLFQNATYPKLAALATVITLLSSLIVFTTLLLAGRRRGRAAA